MSYTDYYGGGGWGFSKVRIEYGGGGKIKVGNNSKIKAINIMGRIYIDCGFNCELTNIRYYDGLARKIVKKDKLDAGIYFFDGYKIERI